MTTMTRPAPEVTAITLVERRTQHLREAIASGDEPTIARAESRLERARTSAAKQAARASQRAELQRQVDQVRREAARDEKARAADAIEAQVRERAAPYCEIHFAGRSVRVDLGARDQVARTTAREMLRRVAWVVSEDFRALCVRARQTLTCPAMPVSDEALVKMLGADAGLRPGLLRQVVTIDGRRPGFDDEEGE
jgi:multidrug efflux pump subunit AcrA (membrane-fusion protein)